MFLVTKRDALTIAAKTLRAPVGSGGSTLDMAPKQIDISPVGSPKRIEHVAKQRDSPDQPIDCHIPYHARDEPFGCSKLASFVHDIERRSRRDDVAYAGYQTNRRVQSNTNVCPRNEKRRVKKIGQRVEPLKAFSV
jgi:hypothetical protein